MQLLFYFLLLRHENKDRLPSFAVNLDEDPTDIFGAVCALLVCSALLKNCNNFLLRKIALPYPHKCLLGFVEAKRGDQQEYLKIILVREVNPVVSDRCACAQHIVGWTLSRDPHSIFGRRGGNT